MENKYSIADELDTWQKQQDYLSIMKALSNKFDSVYILDMDTGIVVPFFLSEKNFFLLFTAVPAAYGSSQPRG